MSDLTFALRNDDEAWEEPDWGDPGFEQLSEALKEAGLLFVDGWDDDDGLPLSVVLTVRNGREGDVRAVLDKARSGQYGEEAKAYWSRAREA